MNLAYRFPIIFWNCACLISDSGGSDCEEDAVDSETIPMAEIVYEPFEDFTSSENEEDEEDDDEDEEVTTITAKKKKKTKVTKYGKISTAINKISQEGITVLPPDINHSGYTFSPDVENNSIRFGMSGIVKVGREVVANIIASRPYASVDDFLAKVKITKPQMVNLIKAGAFDCFGDRTDIMNQYIESISDQKKDLNLRNMSMLIERKLFPEDLEFEIKVFNFNKYLKKNCKQGDNYLLSEYPLEFYRTHFDEDTINYNDSNSGTINAKKWDKIYNKYMDTVREYIKTNKTDMLSALNVSLKQDVIDKYCLGNLSKWEMDSISYYNHPHEMSYIDDEWVVWDDFFTLDEEPVVERTFQTKDNKIIPLFKIYRIAGTVLDKDKLKKTLTILTTTGVVTVKIFGDAFVHYDKQISVRDENTGKKKIIEKSMVARGNKIIITGIRRGNFFIAKKYKSTPYHLIEKIEQINDDGSFEVFTRE